MKAYRITGEFRMGSKQQPFTLETLAESENDATEWAYSVLGSRHRTNRRQITIDSIEQEDLKDIEDDRVRHELEEED